MDQHATRATVAEPATRNEARPTPDGERVRVGILTSGGDAQGMNAAVRAVVRTALRMGAHPSMTA